jgi:aminoglycoside phosphotransferase (APT) family kinase protein
LRAYEESPLLARVRYVDVRGRYFVYQYIEGERLPQSCPGVSKATSLVALARQLLSLYRPAHELVPADEVEQLAWQPSWIASVPTQRQRFGGYLPLEAEALALELAEASLRRTPARDGCLLHGDPGPHNFLFRQSKLVGVIDPTVRTGEPIYDLARAFAAWPGDFALETLLPAVDAIGTWRAESRRALIEAVLPPLYGQVIACLWHHPEDLPEYQEAWAYWARLLHTS